MNIYAGLIFIIFFLRCTNQNSENDFYKATVVEYTRKSSTGINIQKYTEYIAIAAKDKSDIIVFPESALISKPRIKSLVPRPEENVIPYQNESYPKDEPMSKISKAAAEGKIYVVVNLLESENCTRDENPKCPLWGYFTYNTNVVFDRNGVVIARYRKFNLFDELDTTRPDKAEMVYFQTDFGVTFGTFTCFDILFKSPTLDLLTEKNITNFIFPTYWFGELPFLTAIQMQAGWSSSLNVNLLASGANKPTTGSTGSGFYHGNAGRFMFHTEAEGDYLITTKMPKYKPEKDARSTYKFDVNIASFDVKDKELLLLKDPSQSRVTRQTLNRNAREYKDTICSGKLCCKFEIEYNENVEYEYDVWDYNVIAYQGLREFGLTTKGYVSYCAVVLCKGDDCRVKPETKNFPLIFTSIKIQGVFNGSNSFHMPDTLIWLQDDTLKMKLNTLENRFFNYTVDSTNANDQMKVSMELTKGHVDNLMTFGIFGRDFSNGQSSLKLYQLLFYLPLLSASFFGLL